jgi:HSP20 family molecular chaperone IbpA
MEQVLDTQIIDRTIEEVAELYKQMTGQTIEGRKPDDLPPEKDPLLFVGERLARLNTMVRERLFGAGALGEWSAPPAPPPVDLSENEAHVVMTMDVPGVSRDELSLTVVHDVLMLTAERRLDRAPAAGVARIQERPTRYHRLVPLPVRVRNDHIDAQLKDGVLTVRLERESASVWPPKS